MPQRKRKQYKYVKDPNLCLLPGENSGPVWADPWGNGYPELRELYFQLLRSFSPSFEHNPKPSDRIPVLPNTGSFYPHGIFPTYHVMTPEQQKLVNETYMAMGRAIQTAYGRGLDYGRDILGQLARGDIKIGDFEKPHKRCTHCGVTLPTGNTVCPQCHAEQSEPS
jgi:hypothetical protein